MSSDPYAVEFDGEQLSLQLWLKHALLIRHADKAADRLSQLTDINHVVRSTSDRTQFHVSYHETNRSDLLQRIEEVLDAMLQEVSFNEEDYPHIELNPFVESGGDWVDPHVLIDVGHYGLIHGRAKMALLRKSDRPDWLKTAQVFGKDRTLVWIDQDASVSYGRIFADIEQVLWKVSADTRALPGRHYHMRFVAGTDNLIVLRPHEQLLLKRFDLLLRTVQEADYVEHAVRDDQHAHTIFIRPVRRTDDWDEQQAVLQGIDAPIGNLLQELRGNGFAPPPPILETELILRAEGLLGQSDEPGGLFSLPDPSSHRAAVTITAPPGVEVIVRTEENQR